MITLSPLVIVLAAVSALMLLLLILNHKMHSAKQNRRKRSGKRSVFTLSVNLLSSMMSYNVT